MCYICDYGINEISANSNGVQHAHGSADSEGGGTHGRRSEPIRLARGKESCAARGGGRDEPRMLAGLERTKQHGLGEVKGAVLDNDPSITCSGITSHKRTYGGRYEVSSMSCMYRRRRCW